MIEQNSNDVRSDAGKLLLMFFLLVPVGWLKADSLPPPPPLPSTDGPPTTTAAEMRQAQNKECMIVTCYDCGLALRAKDAEFIRAFLYASDDPEGKFVAAEAKHMIAVAQLKHALNDRFGGHVASQVLADRGLEVFDPFRVVIAEWNFKDDKATASKPEGVHVVFRKVKGNWKIDVTPNDLHGSVEQRSTTVQAQADAIARIVKDVDNHEHIRDPSDVVERLKHAGVGPAVEGGH